MIVLQWLACFRIAIRSAGIEKTILLNCCKNIFRNSANQEDFLL